MFHLAARLWLACALGACVAYPAGAQTIKLRNETIHTPARSARAATAAPQTEAAEPAVSGLFLVQLEGPVQPEWTEALQALGVELIRYVPDNTFVARLQNVPPGRVRANEFVRWVGPYRPEHKLHGNVSKRAREKPGDALWLSVLLAPGSGPAALGAARQNFQAVGSESHSRFGVVLRGQVAPGRLQALTASSDVLWIEPGPTMRLNDEIATKIVAGDGGPGRSLAQEFGYDGRDVTVAVADSGLDTGEENDLHPDLAGRVTAFLFYGNLEDASDEHSHGTHVAGIIAGNGATGEMDDAGALFGLGVAPGARLVVQRLFDAEGNYEAPPTFETMTRDAVRAGAEIGSNSWGDDTQGRYDLSAMEFDGLVRDADALAGGDQPYILEFSAGNAGPGAQTIGSPAVGKNVIASGACQNDRVEFFLYEDGAEAMADFSSRGPCEDGRIKPDVVAPGTWIASLRSEYANDDFAWASISDNYMYQGGTSQSGPHVSGAAAVFVQYYRELNTNRTPSPAMVKAALINSAVDMDDSVETDPAPNMDEGWGRVDLTELLFSSRAGQFFDQAVLLRTGQMYERRVIIASEAEPLKVTLTYTDVPGFPAAIPALVNDLDLEVIGPDGTVFRGNQFDEGESIPNAPAADAINNVEGVHLFEPLPGEYIVRIRARNVVQDARHDTPSVDQDFALAISGDIPLPGLGFVFLDRRAYTAPSRIQVRVIDSDLAGQPNVSITLKSTTQPGGVPLVLMPAGSPGSFTGSVATVISPLAGRLQIVHGDTIQAEYFDSSLGSLRFATARGDLLPPDITAVGTRSQFAQTLILWLTDELASSVVHFGTNNVLNRTVTNAVMTRDHEVRLADLVPGVTYQFLVISEDEAGNRSTNSNNGSYFTLIPSGPPTVLLVDAYNNDEFGAGPDIPLSVYTDVLNQIGIDYEVWDATLENGTTPLLSDLRPYGVVIWRVSDNIFLGDSLTVAEQTAVQQYVEGGGSFFMASMEQLSRLGGAFKQNVLQVASFLEDDTAPSAMGFVGNPISAGINLGLDYSNYRTEWYEFAQVPDDISDTMTLTTNAMAILHDGFGGVVGLASPRSGVDRPGRVVFLSFPLDAVPEFDSEPNNRLTLMRNILSFLAPGNQGIGAIALGSSEYTLPSLITIEVADSDLAGQGQVATSISSSTEPAGRTVMLSETTRRGVFQGSIPLVATHGPNPNSELRAVGGDSLVATYLDASGGRSLMATGRVEVIAPNISGVSDEPSYVDAIIRWETDEPADALVQFGESPLLGRTAYLSALETSHEVFLDGLRPDRIYYYQVSSRDLAGNVTVANQGGALYTFRTLLPFSAPWFDDLEHGQENWTVFSGDESEGGWQYGIPNNGAATAGHSGLYAWGSNLDGGPIGYVESFLISPPIDLSGGNTATLRFWQNYDFFEYDLDILNYGEVMLITNAAVAPVTLGFVTDLSGDWEEAEFDLTPHLGKLVYVVWHYVLFSFENEARPAWLIDDVSVTTSQIVPATIRITNNLWQARWVLTGQANRTGQGVNTVLTNLPPGEYELVYNDVPFYTNPPEQAGTLTEGGTLTFVGNYSFADSNNNGMADTWEQQNFGVVAPDRTRATDTDGDGFTDAAEFAAGTQPTQPNSSLRLATPVALTDGAVRLEWPSVLGRAYLVEGSKDGRTWTPISSWIQAGSTLSFFTPPTGPGAPSMFRLQVKP